MKPAACFLSSLLVISLFSCRQRTEVAQPADIFLTPDIMCGTVQFTDGCGASTDTLIRFGLALIHHMTYDDAAHIFGQVIAADPDCFWGYWGKAMTYIHPLWPDAPTPDELVSGLQLSRRALSVTKNEKEKLYGEALAAFYAEGLENKGQRSAAFQKGWAKATEALPDDPEAALFNGLFRLGITPPSDPSFAVQKEVGEMAEKWLETYPDHPGAFHYAIHAYDVPPFAERALAVARTYGKIAPEIPHALHMPSHIFTRLGYWEESVLWNSRSAKAAAGLPKEGKISGHYFHAADYKVYALLQQARDEDALEELKALDTFTIPPEPNAASAYALAAIPSRIALENHDWQKAAALPEPDTVKFPWSKFPQWEALSHYARGLGAARSGNSDDARTAVDRLVALQAKLGSSPPTKYWFDQIEAQKSAVLAWAAFSAGRREEGLSLLTLAASLEDATLKNPVSPGELLPIRELLGDMLMEANDPAGALVAYERCLTDRPNRFNSLYGAGEAAERSGDKVKAKAYYSRIMEMPGAVNSTRERVQHAKEAMRHHEM